MNYNINDVNETMTGLYITSSASVLPFVISRLNTAKRVSLCVNTAYEHVSKLSAEINKYCETIDWPLDDSQTQEISGGGVLSDLVNTILERLKKGHIVVVFCHQGRSRSAMLVVACMMRHFNIKASKALELLRRKRSIANPNANFMRQLENFV